MAKGKYPDTFGGPGGRVPSNTAPAQKSTPTARQRRHQDDRTKSLHPEDRSPKVDEKPIVTGTRTKGGLKQSGFGAQHVGGVVDGIRGNAISSPDGVSTEAMRSYKDWTGAPLLGT